eukprot:183739_1
MDTFWKALANRSKRSTLLFGMLLFALFLFKRRKRKRKRHNTKAWNYKLLNQMIKDNNISLPAMFIDLDCFEQNIKTLSSIANKYNKTIRIATNSIRCPYLIHHAFKISNGTLKGFMCFNVQEADALVQYAKAQNHTDNGLNRSFNDFLIAYPTVQQKDIATAYHLTQNGIKISLMIDSVEHIRIINRICNDIYCNTTYSSNGPIHKLNVCIDLDMSFRITAIGLRVGAHRSNASDEYDINCILDAIVQSKFIQLSGVMSYEAYVSELPDNNPYDYTIRKWFIRRMKAVVQKHCDKTRQSLVEFIRNKIDCVENEERNDNNLSAFEFVNGGGTANIDKVVQNRFCTEVTAGSGMMQPALLDYFVCGTPCEPAAAFALQITRIAEKDKYVTCKSGGFIASGKVSKIKEPVPFLPRYYVCDTYDAEGFGEVQTPLRVKDASVFHYGDSIFFRPAKAGDIAERFNEYILKRGNKMEQKAQTYRGMGYAFY